MSKTKYSWTMAVTFLAFAVSAAALYKPQQSAPSPVTREIKGHTEDQSGHQSADDFPNCFKQDDSRDLVIDVIAPEIAPNNITLTLLNPSQHTIPPSSANIQDGMAEFRFKDEGKSGKTRKFALPEHLGPGPYVATATITSSARSTKKSAISLQFKYDTYKTDHSQCIAP